MLHSQYLDFPLCVCLSCRFSSTLCDQFLLLKAQTTKILLHAARSANDGTKQLEILRLMFVRSKVVFYVILHFYIFMGKQKLVIKT